MSADELRLSVRGDVLIAHPTGAIDLESADRLTDRIVDAIPAACLGVVLDLTDVSFMDSFGIAVTIGLSQSLVRRRQPLAVVVPEGSPVMRTLRLSNVESHLPIVNGIDEAFSRLSAERSRA